MFSIDPQHQKSIGVPVVRLGELALQGHKGHRKVKSKNHPIQASKMSIRFAVLRQTQNWKEKLIKLANSDENLPKLTKIY